MTRLFWLALLLISPLLIAAQRNHAESATASTEAELKRITEELLDAVATGDRAIWNQYLADTCLYSSEDGRSLTKSQLLEELRPLPAGYEGKLRMTNPQVREYGDTAIIGEEGSGPASRW